MYLLENHCSTTFAQLKDGLDNLTREVEQSRQAPGEFIRDNLDSFIQCFDTLSDILHVYNYAHVHVVDRIHVHVHVHVWELLYSELLNCIQKLSHSWID